ncbi:LEPR-XLL domain-containing protein [Mangrovimicrobium sediminis]|uniref:LEPR-XLL domain-containing protein n=1 Tax=Mangrovimicrobium sediminis TaxID=2562682 RepID=A0A4Z0LYN3_9GAMM|nr:MBL fold metallo-hydrolase [Haliea sp. SAOS-164]TGD72238.1 LEPR-XLL domain-containing protein [Haliea sp. SAOS-164]
MVKVLYAFVAIVALAAAGAWWFLQQPQFGSAAQGAALARVQQSPNYVDGEFRNLVETPLFTADESFASVLLGNLSAPDAQLRPLVDIPVAPVDFMALDASEDMVIWLGHSSFYVQLGGKRFLIDPVFSEVASPLSFVNRAFAGTTVFSAQDMPATDYLLVSHDHWDHLDYPSVVDLKPKVGQVVTGLGMGANFQAWGYDPARIVEGDWWDSVELAPGVTLHVIPARHYSGRALQRNQTLWVGFVLETLERRLLFSGDSGYGPHFAELGRRFGDFDLAALDHGQYDPRWAYIHMTPEEAARAAEELGAAALLPAHVGRFALARHAWDEPLQRIAAASEGRRYHLLTPRIGEPVPLAGVERRSFTRWW